MILGGASFGRDEGDINETADLNNPNFTFRRGVRANDVPRMAKASGLYELPYGVSLSAAAQYFTGFPEQTTVSVSRDTVALTQVTQSLLVAPAGTTRLPSVTMFDMSLKKIFRLGAQRSIEPVLDIFNLGNVSTVTRRTAQLGPSYGRVSNIVRGRMMKLGLNVKF